MKFVIVTIFPDLIKPYLDGSILGRAQKNDLIKISYINPRDYADDKHRKTDDTPYGGGPGMVMKAEPLIKAITAAKQSNPGAQVVYLEPSGKNFLNSTAHNIAVRNKGLILVCGRYEGIDERVKKIHRGIALSVGEYVLAGGELAAAIVIESTARQIKGVLGKQESVEEKRIGIGVPCYTKPDIIAHGGKKYAVPSVLREGNHAKIDKWRAEARKTR